MIRQALISGGVAYHHGLLQPGQPFADLDTLPIGSLAAFDLNRYDLIVVPRSTDGEALRARRYQIARFLDRGGVLVAFGELWSDWFPGCHWQPECAEDILAPVVVHDHPILGSSRSSELHWHPARERWCCHGHLIAPSGANVLVANQRGDAWLYIDRVSTNGVIVASTNLDPDTHAYHGNQQALHFLHSLMAWTRAEAEDRRDRPRRRRIAGLYSGVHFQRAFYEDPEFAPEFTILPVAELESTNLSDYAALWIPRESNQDKLLQSKEKLVRYLHDGGTIVCFDEVNQPWLPSGQWALEQADLDSIRIADHPMVASLTVEQVRWHSHGVYRASPKAEVLIQDGNGNVMLFLDQTSFSGRLLAGTLDPDCHAGFGAGVTRPLLRAILSWVDKRSIQSARDHAESATFANY